MEAEDLKGLDVEELAQSANAAATMLKAMSNPNRLMILCSLLDRELSVNKLNELMPITQSSLSQHLATLRKADLVSTRRDAQTIYYGIKGDSAKSVMIALKEIFCP